MEENNEKKKSKLPVLVAVLSVILVLAVGGVYAYFAARAENSGQTITGQTLDINGNTLSISVQKLNLVPSPAPQGYTAPVSPNLVPANFGIPVSDMTITEVNRALDNYCEGGGYTGCHVWKITASTTQTVQSANIRLNLRLTEVEDEEQWSYIVYTGDGDDDDTDEAVAILNKGTITTDFPTSDSTIDIHNGASLSSSDSAVYYVMVYLNNINSAQNDGNTTGTTDERGTYNGSVTLEAMGGEVKVNFLPTAAEYITSLYLNNKDNSTVTNNSIEYQTASSKGLMNDRLGGTTESLDGGNIRYYGHNPDNYVWLGDTFSEDYTYSLNTNNESLTRTAGSKKLWRIIGVFDGKVKLIQNDPISTTYLSWDTSGRTSPNKINNGWGINQWGPSESYEGADLMKLLNPGYENNEDLDYNDNIITVNNSLYWNKATGTVYTSFYNSTSTSGISFANTGLSISEKNLIDTATWYLGALDQTNIYSNTQYVAERQNNTLGKICTQGTDECDDEVTRTPSWNGKVGLMYASDYGYAVDFDLCTNRLLGYNTYPGDGTGYDNANCKGNNWLYISSLTQWTMSPRASSSIADYGSSVGPSGYLGGNRVGNSCWIRPAVYLKSSAYIVSGTGTEADPYVLSY